MAAEENRNTLLTFYFRLGLSNLEIRAVLAKTHHIFISERHIKRLLNEMGHYRRKNHTDLNLVIQFIQKQLEGPPRMHGYRWMHLLCRQHGLNIDKEAVRQILNYLDPEGVDMRRRRCLVRRSYFARGPNYTWHVDGYDKLKPYGIAISGCIDGFSRNVIWIEARHTNNDPKVVAGFYVNALNELKGCPRVVRADQGTENTYIEQMQTFLRRTDDDTCFIYGKSTLNQRIEAFWSLIRRQCVQFWIEVFEKFKEDGYFTGDLLDRELCRFVFMELIQENLNEVKLQWNHHYIRPSYRLGVSRPYGRPVVMYNTPEVFQAQDFIQNVSQAEIDICADECTFITHATADRDLYDLCRLVMDENHWQFSHNAYEMCDLYLSLRTCVRQELQV